jgi:hypothetical protein
VVAAVVVAIGAMKGVGTRPLSEEEQLFQPRYSDDGLVGPFVETLAARLGQLVLFTVDKSLVAPDLPAREWANAHQRWLQRHAAAQGGGDGHVLLRPASPTGEWLVRCLRCPESGRDAIIGRLSESWGQDPSRIGYVGRWLSLNVPSLIAGADGCQQFRDWLATDDVNARKLPTDIIIDDTPIEINPNTKVTGQKDLPYEPTTLVPPIYPHEFARFVDGNPDLRRSESGRKVLQCISDLLWARSYGYYRAEVLSLQRDLTVCEELRTGSSSGFVRSWLVMLLFAVGLGCAPAATRWTQPQLYLGSRTSQQDRWAVFILLGAILVGILAARFHLDDFVAQRLEAGEHAAPLEGHPQPKRP